jgi:hypothetical protein
MAADDLMNWISVWQASGAHDWIRMTAIEG